MAEVVWLLLPTPPPDIYYKCHRNKLVSVVICVVCNSAYHKGDYNSKKTKRNWLRWLSGLEIICDEHNIDDITSKNPGAALVLLRSKLENSKK